MKVKSGFSFIVQCSIALLFLAAGNRISICHAQGEIWQAGVARMDITPEEPVWLAGYAARDHAAEGTIHPLWAKALALEDKNGNKGVLVTTDLLGFPREISYNIRNQIEEKYGLERSQIILSSTHSHSGPVLRDYLYHIYPISAQDIQRIEVYTNRLESDLVKLVGDAIEKMVPSRIYTGNGVVRFQVNRRNNDAGTLDSQSDLNGPNDYAVPVIKVLQESGELMAVAFGYACHPTVLSSYEYSGDYPGFAQLALEEEYPEATALFFQGCGADQNPLPRRSVLLAKQYGHELAAAVERVISFPSEPLPAVLRTGYSEIELAFSSPPEIAILEKMVEDHPIRYQQNWAKHLLARLEKGDKLPDAYPYPVQTWKIGNQAVFALGGEVVVDYAIQLKRIFGQDAIVMGYCNDVMGYIPSARILREGGYEGATSQMVFGLPGTWKADLETKIIHQLLLLAEETGIELPEKELIAR